ncbi:aromatic amino acid transport family protein [Kistimonas asteriae]|uniref:aromatic amino acid transport family protein n=1 Tax=Kistimonas asteriae TaxID=517724 RepID=UPI001BA9DBD2|nr:aromatic amino acid transport family protein [Kistimonas asteriae]
MTETLTTANPIFSRRKPGVLGGALIVAGSTVGAGMFSLPVVTSGMWFGWSLLLLLGVWFCMYSGGMYLLETNLCYRPSDSFDTLAGDTLGRTGRILNGLSVAFVLYILTYAYVSGGSSVVSHSLGMLTGIELNASFSALLFATVLGVFVVAGAGAVDRITTIMLGGMALTFLGFCHGLLSSADSRTLFPGLPMTETMPYIAGAIPFLMVSFGFQNCIPSLVKYFGKEPVALRRAAIIGTLITLMFYLVWQVSVLGNLERDAFPAVLAAGGNIGHLIGALEQSGVSLGLSLLLQLFSHLAVATSFIGVALGLFDYIADLFGFANDLRGRLITGLMTLAPPTVFAIVAPNGFLAAIGYAGICATVFALIVPVLMTAVCRSRGMNGGYRVPGGTPRMVLVLLFALVVLVCQLMNMAGWLPSFSG